MSPDSPNVTRSRHSLTYDGLCEHDTTLTLTRVRLIMQRVTICVVRGVLLPSLARHSGMLLRCAEKVRDLGERPSRSSVSGLTPPGFHNAGVLWIAKEKRR